MNLLAFSFVLHFHDICRYVWLRFQYWIVMEIQHETHWREIVDLLKIDKIEWALFLFSLSLSLSWKSTLIRRDVRYGFISVFNDHVIDVPNGVIFWWFLSKKNFSNLMKTRINFQDSKFIGDFLLFPNRWDEIRNRFFPIFSVDFLC